MVDDACDPNDETYTILLKLILKKKQVNGPFLDDTDMWKNVKTEIILELSHEVDRECSTMILNPYSAVVKGLCKVDRFEDAKSVLLHMQGVGKPLNADSYTALIDCSCRQKQYVEAVKFIDSMIDCGYMPRIELYRILLSGLFNEWSIYDGILVFTSLLSRGYHHDEIVWKVLIDTLFPKGHVDLCSKMISIMEEKHCSPSPETYAILAEKLSVGNDGADKRVWAIIFMVDICFELTIFTALSS